MDYSLAKSRKEDYRASRRDSSRRDSSQNQLGATRMNDSNDYGFDWLQSGNYDWESSRREEIQMSKREIPEGWDATGATLRDDHGNRVRDNVGRTVKENLGASKHVDLGATGETRRDDAVYVHRATGGNPHGSGRYDYSKEGPYYRELHRPAESIGGEPFSPVINTEQIDYAIDDGLETADGKPRRWTSVAADKSLMGKWHAMFGQIRTKWAPSSGIDSPVAVSRLSDDKSFSDVECAGDGRGRYQRLVIVGVAVVVVIVLAAAIVPTILLTRGGDGDGDVVLLEYKYQATITNRIYDEDMADNSSVAFRTVADDFCDQLDANDANKSGMDFTYKGCAVTEIKNGSLIIIYVIVISAPSSRTVPTSAAVSIFVGITLDAAENVGDFTISITIDLGSPVTITQDESPVRKKVQFNETCSVSEDDRCLTRYSECIDDVCGCPDDRYLNDTTDTCTQIDCGVNPTIDNGNVTSSGNSYGETLNITCDDGYEISNDTTVNCTTQGSWGNLPSCDPIVCIEFKNPNNSEIDTNSTGRFFTEVIQITCHEGYTLENGSFSVICQANKTWSASIRCIPVTCEDFQKPNYSMITPSKEQFVFDENVTVECESGYQLNGGRTISCLANGTWIGVPTCKPVVCEFFTLPEKALIESDNQQYIYNDNVTLQCESGFNIEGDDTVRCQANLSWTALPSCKPITCQTFEPPEHSEVESNTTGMSFGDVLSVSCQNGFTLIGESSISCNANGTWPAISCVDNNCSNNDFMQPENSIVVGWNESSQTFEIECEVGYYIVGNKSVTCVSDKTWSNLPICEPEDCGQPREIPNAAVIGFNDTIFNSTFSVECSEGYTSLNELTVICQSNGIWSDFPTCELVSCGNFTVPDHATVTLEEGNTYNKGIIFECEEGYEMIGQSKILCQENGTWTDNPTCEIKDCGQIGDIQDGGVASQSGTTVGSVSYIRCNDGFDIVGSNNVTCLTTGKWNILPSCRETECGNYSPPEHTYVGPNNTIFCDTGFELIVDTVLECVNGNWSDVDGCKPVECSTFPNIENGTTSAKDGETYVFEDIVDIYCDDGFEISGSSQATCGANKTWENVQTCDRNTCPDFPVPNNAVIGDQNPTNRVFEDEISVNCSDGYILTGNSSSICGADKEWLNIPECNPAICNELPTLPYGMVEPVKQQYVFTDKVNVSCYSGYTLHGNKQITCQSNGTWVNLPVCNPNDCNELNVPENSAIRPNKSRYEYNENLTVICESGYILEGHETISCLDDGTWTNIPTCTPVQCDQLDIANAEITPDGNHYEYNETITVSCENGYMLEGNETISCLEDGTWSNIPTCTLVQCDQLDIANAETIPDGNQYEYNETVIVKCENGYMIEGNGTLKCLEDGTWANIPTCTPVQCDKLDIANAEIIPDGNQYEYNETVIVKCENGYMLDGNESISCLDDGTWTNIPTCTPVKCDQLDIANAEITPDGNQYEYSETVTVKCENGYMLEGNETVRCLDDGTWTNIPTCTPVQCDQLDIANAEITPGGNQYEYNETITVSCENGYMLEGNETISCHEDGTWSNIPTCTLVQCDQLDIANAETIPDGNQYEYNETVIVKCENGYMIEGNGTLKCLENGTWANIPTCTPVQCDQLDIANAEIIPDGNQYEYNETVIVKCENGYMLDGNESISCLDDGTWTNIPTCTPVQCDQLDIANAEITPDGNQYEYNETVTVKCENGYMLDGNESISCLDDGTWTNIPTCTPVQCDQLDIANAEITPDGNQYEYNETVTVKCENGYMLEGNDTISCLDDGTWTNIPACTPVQCDQLNIANAELIPDENQYLYDEIVTVKCGSGYILQGNDSLSCGENGTWMNIPICASVQCEQLDIANAELLPDKTLYDYKENITVKCNSGFMLEDYEIAYCLANGTWTGVPTCSPVECELFSIPEKALILREQQQYLYRDNVTLECETGYMLDGDSVVRCQANSSWTLLPVCNPVTCKPIQIPENAKTDTNLTGLTFEDKISVDCRSGFILVGYNNITCNSNGTWPDINCVQVNCSTDDFSKPQNSLVLDVNESLSLFEIECLKGYYIVGNASVTCIAGNWSDIPTCEIIDCGEYIPEISNHFIDSDAVTTYNSSVNVKCIDGLELTNGSTTFITCGANGEWHGDPDCEITGKVSFTESSYFFNKGRNETTVCEVTEYPKWQTVMVAKLNTQNEGMQIPVFRISRENGSIVNETFDTNNELSISFNSDGVSVSLNFRPATCDDEGIYMCAAIVGDPMNATEIKSTSTNVSVSCVGCGDYEPARGTTLFVQTNGVSPVNTSLAVKCIDGLEFTTESVTEVICGVDGQWQGEPDCRIPGEVSFTGSSYSFNEGQNETIVCEVTDNENWQTVMVEKIDTQNEGLQIPLFRISRENGSIVNETFGTNYGLNTSFQSDSVSVSLNFRPATCDDEGIYMCAAIVGNPMNATEIKSTSTNVSVSCVGCGEYEPARGTMLFVQTNGVSPVNTSLAVKCIDGLEFTTESVTEVICGADGQWQGEPDCRIPGEVSFTGSSYSFNEGQNETVVCVVTDNENWQTVMVAKIDTQNEGMQIPLFRISHENGSIVNETLGTNYGLNTSHQSDGVFVSLNFRPATCDDEGIYTCAAIVGDPMNATEIKSTSTNVSVSCVGCGDYEPARGTTLFVQTNGVSPVNTSLAVKCIDGLVFTTESVTEVICGADGQWQGEPDCRIPGEVSFTGSSYSFNEGQNETVVCEVTDNENWQTVMVAKIDTPNEGLQIPLFRISRENGSIVNETFGTNYGLSTSVQSDSVSVSLNFRPTTCDDEGIYMCATIVGDPMNATEIKSTSTHVSVSCVGCGDYEPARGTTVFVQTNGVSTVNTSLAVKCIDGLEFTTESVTEVICGADGQWQGEPDCRIPGEVSFTGSSYSFNEGQNETVVCEVTDNENWQTVMVAKIDTQNEGLQTPLFRISRENGSIINETIGTYYGLSTSVQSDGVSVSLNFRPATCDDEGIYMCAAIVGDPMNATEIKSTSTNVSVSCVGCGDYEPARGTTVFVQTNGVSPVNTSLAVKCIDGLVFTTESVTEVICGADGQWQGEPDCRIPGEVSFTGSSYYFNEGQNETVVCEVTDNENWQTVMVAKIDTQNEGLQTPLFRISRENGSIINETLGANYGLSTSVQSDGVSVSLNFRPATCDDEGIYMCAAIIGDPMNATEIKSTSTNVSVSCVGCGDYEPARGTTVFVQTNGVSPVNTSLAVKCIDGLVFTTESVTEVICGADGQWQGEPDCRIPGEVSFTGSSYYFNEGQNETVVCEVTDNENWQTVMVAKIDTQNEGLQTPLFRISRENGSIINETLSTNYGLSTSVQSDGVSVSLNFRPATCDDEGIYMCAAIVGDQMNATEIKSTSTNVSVSCVGCGDYEPARGTTVFVQTNGVSPVNTSLAVKCIDGLVFTTESVTEVICGADGQWQGEPDCRIPGEVSFTGSSYSFNEGQNETVVCEVTDNENWQTVMVAKIDTQNEGLQIPLFRISRENGSIINETLSTNYGLSTSVQSDGVSVSLIFRPATCDDEGIYMCAAIVGDPMNATEIKSTSTNVSVSCFGCGDYESARGTTVFVQTNGVSPVNTSLAVKCIDGLVFTTESVTEVICGADGQWQGEPDCSIPGEVSFTGSSYSFNEGQNETVVCEVTDNENWQTVMVAKIDTQNEGLQTPLFRISRENGSIINETLGTNYGLSTSVQSDGVSVSLNFRPATCDDEGIYMCAAIVGDPMNATEIKSTSTNVSVSCVGCGDYESARGTTVFVQTNGVSPVNTSLAVKCIDGLVFTTESVTEVICGADGQWQGEPDCRIPGEVSFTGSSYSFNEGQNETVVCEVTDNENWQTVMVAKIDTQNEGLQIQLFLISRENGSIVNETFGTNYGLSTSVQSDGVSVSLNFRPATCDDEGIYMCAAIVGDPMNATEIKSTSTNVSVSCTSCENYEPARGTTLFVQTNGVSPVNTSLAVKCIDGLEFTTESVTEVTCVDGQWQGEPDCRISGNLTFTHPEYSFKIGDTEMIMCEVTDYPTWQTVLLAKVVNLSDAGYNPIVLVSNGNGSTPSENVINDSYTISTTSNETGVSVAMILSTLACDNEGMYMCAAIVGDPEDPIDIKTTRTNVTVSSDSSSPEISVPDTVYLGRKAEVKCTGRIGKGSSGDSIGKLSVVTNFGDNGSITLYNSSDAPKEDGCYFTDAITVPIPTDSSEPGLWAKCVIRHINGTDLESEQKNISIRSSYVAFENTSYLFNVGEEATLVCGVENIPGWKQIEIKSEKGIVIAVNGSDLPLETGDSHISLLANESFLADSSGRLAVVFDPVQCSDTPGDMVGVAEYTCAVEAANETIEAKTSVTFQRPPSAPELTMSHQIIDGQDTWADRAFKCAGEVGDPPGHIEVESDFDGEFNTFLTPFSGGNETSFGVVVNEAFSKTNCGNDKTLEFALKDISMGYMHLKNLRCVIKPSEDLVNGKVMYSEQKVIKIVPDNYCEGSTMTYIPHPYYCNLAVICNDDGTVNGVPGPCNSDQCADTTEGSTYQCTDCHSVGECKTKGVQCDEISITAYIGNVVSFTCNIQDFGQVTHIAVNDLTDVDVDVAGESIKVKKDVNVTVSQYYVLLSFANVSCDQEGDYVIKLNNETDFTLRLGIISDVEDPVLALPVLITANQEMTVNCSGQVGRDEEGKNKTAIYLDVMFQDSSEYTVHNGEEKREAVDETCEISEKVMFSIIPDVSWNNSLVRCVSRNETAAVAYSSSERMVLQLPALFCQPLLQKREVGSSVIFMCILKDVPTIDSVVVSRNETELINIDNVTLPFVQEYNADVILTVASVTELHMNFSDVTCEQEGAYQIRINDGLSATQTLRIISPAMEPSLNKPSEARVNEQFEISCSGDVGRDEEGNAVSNFYLEIRLANESEFSIYNDDVTREPVVLNNCQYTETVRLTFFPDASWNNSEVRCVARNETDIITSSTTQKIHLDSPSTYFESTDLTGVVGESLILTCIVANMNDLSNITISKGTNNTVIASYTSQANREDVTVVTEDSSIDGSAGVLKINMTVQCGDDGIYYCKPTGSGTTTEAVASVQLQRKPGLPMLTMSREIIENKFTLGDRLFYCDGDVGDPGGSIEILSNFNGSFETFLSPEPGLRNNSIGWIVSDPTDNSSCRNFRTVGFAFYNVTMEMQSKRLRCVIHPASELVVPLEDLYDEKAINIVPDDYCVGQSGYKSHPYFCHLRVECSVSGGKINGVPRGCDEDECYNDVGTCVNCSSIGGCNITEPTTTTSTTTTTPSPDSAHMICEDLLLGQNGETAELNCSLKNIDIDFNNLTESPIIVAVDSSLTPIFNSSKDSLSDSNSFVTPNGVEIIVETNSIMLQFKPLQCQHVGTYTFKYLAAETSSQVDIIANISIPNISKQPEKFYRHQKVSITCTGDVGRPKRDLVLQVNKVPGDDNWQEVSDVQPTESETNNCTIVITATHDFYVDDSVAGYQYRCSSKGDNGEVLNSEIESVAVSGAVVYFTEAAATAEIGGSMELNCVLEGTPGSNGAVISRKSVRLGEEHLCNMTNAGSVTCVSMHITGSVSVSESNLTATVGIAQVNCDDEGTYYCGSVNDSSLQALMTLSVTKPPAGEPLLTVPARMVVGLTEYASKISCSANVGYPPGDIRIEYTNDNFTTFEIFNLGTEEPLIEEEGCSVNKTIAFKQYTYTESWNNTDVRCAVYNAADESEPAEVSDTQTIRLINNVCTTGGDVYQYHPLNCHYFIYCNGVTPDIVTHCGSDCPYIQNSTITPDCIDNCSAECT